jgi:hypothetical protein
LSHRICLTHIQNIFYAQIKVKKKKKKKKKTTVESKQHFAGLQNLFSECTQLPPTGYRPINGDQERLVRFA